jgi:hypothetical protein
MGSVYTGQYRLWYKPASSEADLSGMGGFMMYIVLIGAILLAVLVAAAIIGIVIYLNRRKKNSDNPAPGEDLTAEQADEVTSTWNLLNH